MHIAIYGGDTAGVALDDMVGAARAAEEQGFHGYYLPQIFGLDPIVALTVIAREVPRIELGTTVVPTYTHHPITLAQQALTLNLASGGRFVLGVGLSHQFVIESMYGLSFEKPLRHMREYLSALIPLIRDGSVSYEGETIRTQGALDVAGRLPCPVVVAALGPKMLDLAGTVADGTVTWMTGPATLEAHTIPAITQAAERAGRPSPRVTVSLPVCVEDDIAKSRQWANAEFAVYGMLPSYRAMLDREGAEGPGDVAITGDEAAVTEQIRHLADIGVTHFGAADYGPQEARDHTRTLLRSLL